MMQEEIKLIQDEINAFIISNELELDKFRIDFVGRRISASAAAGSQKNHLIELEKILNDAL
jgi:2-oxoglutarate dehydrogenase complex dehydrogenase (E1) component-like enzyme